MNPATAALLADTLLALHLGVVVFVVGLLPLVLEGFIASQASLGRLCPLPVWEQVLRHLAGQAADGENFIELWHRRQLHWNLPWWSGPGCA